MGYYLTENVRSVPLKEVTWAKCGYEDKNPNNLEHIVNFCLDHKSEKEIKLHLGRVAMSEKLSGIRDDLPQFHNHLNIKFQYRRKKEDITKTIGYGILPYSQDRDFFEYEHLRSELQALREDFVFLRRLARNFSGNPKQAGNILTFKEAAFYLEGGLEYFIDEEEDRFNSAMTDFVQRQILEIDKSDPEKTVYNYRRLFNLAMFVIKYKRDKQKSSKKSKIILPRDNEENLTRKLESPKPTIEQMTIF